MVRATRSSKTLSQAVLSGEREEGPARRTAEVGSSLHMGRKHCFALSRVPKVVTLEGGLYRASNLNPRASPCRLIWFVGVQMSQARVLGRSSHGNIQVPPCVTVIQGLLKKSAIRPCK